MLHNWVCENTATTGTGAVTLAGAVTGYTTFAQTCADQELVPYIIRDGNDYESGVGVFTAAGTTLTRSIIREKLAGGVITRNPATGLSLSGSAKVEIDASADAFMPAYPQALSGEVVSGHLNAGFGYSQGLANTFIYVVPFLLERGGKVSALKLKVATAGTAGSRTRAALYHVNLSGGVGPKIYETADIITDTTGVKVDTPPTPLYLRPGWYYYAIAGGNSPSIGAVFGGYQTARLIGVSGADATAGLLYGSIAAYNGGALPAIPSLAMPPGAWSVPVLSMVLA